MKALALVVEADIKHSAPLARVCPVASSVVCWCQPSDQLGEVFFIKLSKKFQLGYSDVAMIM